MLSQRSQHDRSAAQDRSLAVVPVAKSWLAHSRWQVYSPITSILSKNSGLRSRAGLGPAWPSEEGLPVLSNKVAFWAFDRASLKQHAWMRGLGRPTKKGGRVTSPCPGFGVAGSFPFGLVSQSCTGEVYGLFRWEEVYRGGPKIRAG